MSDPRTRDEFVNFAIVLVLMIALAAGTGAAAAVGLQVFDWLKP